MRFIVGILITLGLLILVLVLLLRGGGGPSVKPLVLTDYAHTDSVASLTMSGPITSQSTHQEVEIDVSNSNVSFTMFNGYQRDVVNSQTYPNNDDAYLNFLAALEQEGFTKGSTRKDLSDERGFCPLGTRDVYTFSNDSDQLQRLWTSSCGGGTFKGRGSTINTLFERQVPNYNDLISNSQFTGF